MNSADLEKAASRITMEGLVKNFTVGELNAMTAFYGSPDGQSASKKFGAYMAGIMPQIQQEVKKAMDEKQKQQEPKDQPEAGAPRQRRPGSTAKAPPAASIACSQGTGSSKGSASPKGTGSPQIIGNPTGTASPTGTERSRQLRNKPGGGPGSLGLTIEQR